MNKLIMLLLVTFSFTAFSQAELKAQSPYEEGLHYTALNPVFDTESTEQVIIYEFFGYKCPHCASFQTFAEPWKKKLPKHVKFVRVPVVFQPGWDILAKAYYTAETMGIIDKTHRAMFNAIHKERKRFRTMDEVADWYAKNFNVDKKAFLSTANSFMIDSKIRQSDNMMRKMKITSTPAIIVNGKYKPNKKVLGNNAAILELATFLSDKEAKTMGLTK